MIDKYKKGELSDEQMEQLESELLRQMFRKEKENTLRSDLKKLALDINSSENTEGVETPLQVVHRSNRSWTWLAAAASVALLVLAGWWLFIKPQAVTPLSAYALADNYLKKDATPVWSATMGNDTPAEKEAKAKDAYQKAEYEQAILLIESIPPTTKEQFFYLGISALKQRQPAAQKAIDNLLKARTIGNGWQEDAINWYIALAYLNLNKTTEAKAELNNIIKIGRDNVTRAKELLSQIQ